MGVCKQVLLDALQGHFLISALFWHKKLSEPLFCRTSNTMSFLHYEIMLQTT